jgi:CCR4-NOT complex subunit CAF16
VTTHARPIPPPAIEVRGLAFGYAGTPSPVLRDLTFTVDAGSRCLLIGANGAGKTTLLRVLAGKHMIGEDVVRVLGRPAFHDTALAARVAFLGGTFPFDADVRVGALLDHAPAHDGGRRALLIDVLAVDLDWHMHRVSDGQRRRVQILLGLLAPSELLLLDEVTTDLDVIARQDLLAFLRADSERHGTTLLYATHIFDGLDEWATHLLYLIGGRLARLAALADVAELTERRQRGDSAPLLHTVVTWLRAEARGPEAE